MEHPCAKIIKQALTDYEIYLSTIFTVAFESVDPVALMGKTSSMRSFVVFNEWRKRCERRGVDIFNVPKKKKQKYLGVTGTMKSLMHYQNIQIMRAARKNLEYY